MTESTQRPSTWRSQRRHAAQASARHVGQKEDKSKTQAPHAKVKSRKQTKTLLLFEVSDWLRSSVRIFRTLSINAPSAHRVAVNHPLAAWYSIVCSDCVCVDSELENIEEGREVGPTPIHFDSWRAIGVVPRKRQKRERKSCQRNTALRRGEVRIFQRHQLVVLECPASLLSSASVTRGIGNCCLVITETCRTTSAMRKITVTWRGTLYRTRRSPRLSAVEWQAEV